MYHFKRGDRLIRKTTMSRYSIGDSLVLSDVTNDENKVVFQLLNDRGLFADNEIYTNEELSKEFYLVID